MIDEQTTDIFDLYSWDFHLGFHTGFIVIFISVNGIPLTERDDPVQVIELICFIDFIGGCVPLSGIFLYIQIGNRGVYM